MGVVDTDADALFGELPAVEDCVLGDVWGTSGELDSPGCPLFEGPAEGEGGEVSDVEEVDHGVGSAEGVGVAEREGVGFENWIGDWGTRSKVTIRATAMTAAITVFLFVQLNLLDI